ncbi:acetyltransferase [Nocardioides sp. WV_118_6]
MRLYVFGAGSHGRELAWLAREIHGPSLEVVFLVDDERYVTDPVHGDPVRLLTDDIEPRGQYVVALGDAVLRRQAASACERAGLTAATLVHPRVERSERVDIGPGSVIAAGSVLTTDITIGRHVHVNIGCTISHDAVLGDFATLAPGVKLAGNVSIGSGAFLGIGASVIDGRTGDPLVIGADAVVAAGACVTGPVAPRTLVAGVPAVQKR